MRCPTCQVPLTDTLVSIRFRGQRRGLSVKLNGVHAQMCPHCDFPVLEPEVRDELEALRDSMVDTAGPMHWHVERAA